MTLIVSLKQKYEKLSDVVIVRCKGEISLLSKLTRLACADDEFYQQTRRRTARNDVGITLETDR